MRVLGCGVKIQGKAKEKGFILCGEVLPFSEEKGRSEVLLCWDEVGEEGLPFFVGDV